jgi:hypothetical protein
MKTSFEATTEDGSQHHPEFWRNSTVDAKLIAGETSNGMALEIRGTIEIKVIS